MSDLISRIRTFVNDPAGADQLFDDQAIQDYLDRRRLHVRFAALRAEPTIKTGGVLEWHDYFADLGDWEADLQLTDRSYQSISADTSDLQVGYWTFTANQYPMVYITGKTYDVYGTAADLLEAWAATLKLKFAFASNGQSYHPEQQQAGVMALAGQYRSRQRQQTALMTRDDISPVGPFAPPVYDPFGRW